MYGEKRGGKFFQKYRMGKLHGSYTVEAAFVLPVVLLVMVLIWYTGAFWHNQIVCRAICQEAVYAGMKARWEGKDEAAAMQQVLSAQTGSLFLADQMKEEQQVSGNWMKASITVKMHFPFGYLHRTDVNTWEISEQARLQAEHPVAAVRRIRRIRRWKEFSPNTDPGSEEGGDGQ